ncbi:MAG TPA: hypothetical protein VMW56_14460 [Candidatus Margulisiibacteriota bacterium]|nr:hypothetical protein [Candidatus Margulisiibacteriota bacterium]
MSEAGIVQKPRYQRKSLGGTGTVKAEPKTRATPRTAIKKQAAEDAALLAQGEEMFVEELEREKQQAKAKKVEVERRSSRANPRHAEFQDENGNIVRRNIDRNANPFDIPAGMKEPGMDYEWKTIRVVGQQVDPAEVVEIRNGGWRPAPASKFRGLLPSDWDKPHVERGGQVLYMRPLSFTLEARQEDLNAAEEQKTSKLRGSLANPDDLRRATKREVDDFKFAEGTGASPRGKD